MEIVCAPETYRRFESSSLRHENAPIVGAFFSWRREDIVDFPNCRRFARAPSVSDGWKYSRGCRRRDALPTCWQNPCHENAPFVGAFFRGAEKRL